MLQKTELSRKTKMWLWAITGHGGLHPIVGIRMPRYAGYGMLFFRVEGSLFRAKMTII